MKTECIGEIGTQSVDGFEKAKPSRFEIYTDKARNGALLFHYVLQLPARKDVKYKLYLITPILFKKGASIREDVRVSFIFDGIHQRSLL